MQARIYKPTKNSMQSGTANTKYWVFEFFKNDAKFIEPVMNWTASTEMLNEVRIKFPTKEAAVEFAKKNNYDYEISEPQVRKIAKRLYADNFK